PARLEARADGVDAHERRVLHDHPGNRAGVFGIDIDRARLERAIGHTGSTEPDLARHAGLAHLLDDLGDDLRDDVALGERLRSHADDAVGRASRRRGIREHGHQQRTPEPVHRSPPAAEGAAALPDTSVCAVRNWLTNGVAGRSARSANVPCCTTRPDVISVMVSPSSAASRISCVTRTTVLPSVANSRPSWAWSSART